jgi:hypothetical protein
MQTTLHLRSLRNCCERLINGWLETPSRASRFYLSDGENEGWGKVSDKDKPEQQPPFDPMRAEDTFLNLWVLNQKTIADIPDSLKKLVTETIPVDARHMEHRLHDGREFAQNVLQFGAVCFQPRDDLRRWGCFIAQGQAPTAKEIEAAQAALLNTQFELATEALAFRNDGPHGLQNITKQHIKALKYVAEHFYD